MGNNRFNWERKDPGVSHKTWSEKRVADLRDKPLRTCTCPDPDCFWHPVLEPLLPGFDVGETEREGG